MLHGRARRCAKSQRQPGRAVRRAGRARRRRRTPDDGVRRPARGRHRLGGRLAGRVARSSWPAPGAWRGTSRSARRGSTDHGDHGAAPGHAPRRSPRRARRCRGVPVQRRRRAPDGAGQRHAQGDRLRRGRRRPRRPRGGRGRRDDASLFAPYTAEEMWERLGYEPTVALAGWPQADPALLVEETVTASCRSPARSATGSRCRPTIGEDELRELALAAPGVVKALDGARASARSSCGRPSWSTSCRPSAAALGSVAMEHRVAMVTDSTAYLPADLVASRHVLVVPVQVVVGGQPFDEGTEITPTEVAEALRSWRVVTTSRPSPERFAARLRRGRGVRRHGCGLGPPVRRHVRHLRLGRPRGARGVDPRGGRRHPPRRDGDGLRRPRGCTRRGVGSRSGARGRGCARPCRREQRPVLRRHARLPASRRSHRRRDRARRPGARGEADPRARRRPRRPAGEGADHVEGPRAARGAGGRARRRPGVRHRCAPPRRAPPARSPSPVTSWLDSTDSRVLVGEVGAVVGAHVGPGMVAVAVSPRPTVS